MPRQPYVNSSIFLPLSKLPIIKFTFGFGRFVNKSLSKKVFAPLTKITYLQTSFAALPAMVSVHSSLQILIVVIEPTFPVQVLNNNSLQVLQKFNSSLTDLTMALLKLQRVEDYTFSWTPSLLILGLANNQIYYVAENAFYGLNSLRELNLYNNLLIHIPSGALEVFRKSASLVSLSLGANRIIELSTKDTFSAVSHSLTYLNLDISTKVSVIHINWIGLLHHLKTLIFSCSRDCHLSPHIFIESRRLLPSLQSVTIKSLGTVELYSHNLFAPCFQSWKSLMHLLQRSCLIRFFAVLKHALTWKSLICQEP